MKLNSQELTDQDSPNSGVASQDSLIPTSTDQMIKLKINVPNVKPHLMIQPNCLIVKQIQPAFPLPAYWPTLSKPLISFNWKNSKILTEDKATTTTVHSRELYTVENYTQYHCLSFIFILASIIHDGRQIQPIMFLSNQTFFFLLLLVNFECLEFNWVPFLFYHGPSSYCIVQYRLVRNTKG